MERPRALCRRRPAGGTPGRVGGNGQRSHLPMAGWPATTAPPELAELARDHEVGTDAVAIAAALAQPWVDMVLSGAVTAEPTPLQRRGGRRAPIAGRGRIVATAGNQPGCLLDGAFHARLELKAMLMQERSPPHRRYGHRRWRHRRSVHRVPRCQGRDPSGDPGAPSGPGDPHHGGQHRGLPPPVRQRGGDGPGPGDGRRYSTTSQRSPASGATTLRCAARAICGRRRRRGGWRNSAGLSSNSTDGGRHDIELLSGDEVRSRFPYIGPDVLQARFRAGDGFLDPRQLALGLIEGSSADVVVSCEVTGFGVTGGRVVTVETSLGSVSTEPGGGCCRPVLRCCSRNGGRRASSRDGDQTQGRRA